MLTTFIDPYLYFARSSSPYSVLAIRLPSHRKGLFFTTKENSTENNTIAYQNTYAKRIRVSFDELECTADNLGIVNQRHEYELQTISDHITRGNSARLGKFVFTKETKLLPLQAVREHGADFVPHGNKYDYFGKIVDTIAANIPQNAWSKI